MASNLSHPIQLLRGTKATIAGRIGEMGEMNYAYDTHELYAHDGVTPGGYLIGGGTPWWKETGGEFHFYMSTTGSDDNDGRTPETAVATLPKALQLTTQFTYGSVIPIINIAAGTYDIGRINVNRYCRSGCHTVIRGVDRDTVILQGMLVMDAGPLSIQNLTIAPRTDQLALLTNITPAFLHAGQGSFIATTSVSITMPDINGGDSTSYRCIHCDNHSFVLITGAINIHCSSSNSIAVANSNHASTALNGTMTLSGICSIVLNTAYNSIFYMAANGSFAGSITGHKYGVNFFSVLNLLGQGPNIIPGTEDGIVGEYSVVV